MRTRIISAYKDLSTTKGFYNVTVDELAAHAGISKRTLYKYFKSKEDIIEAVLDGFMQEIASGFEKIVTTEKDFSVMMAEMIKHFSKTAYPVLNPMVLRDLQIRYPQFWKKIEDFRAEKIKNFISILMSKSNKAENVDQRILTTAFIASIQAVVNPEFILSNNLTFDNTAKQLVELFAYGFMRKE